MSEDNKIENEVKPVKSVEMITKLTKPRRRKEPAQEEVKKTVKATEKSELDNEINLDAQAVTNDANTIEEDSASDDGTELKLEDENTSAVVAEDTDIEPVALSAVVEEDTSIDASESKDSTVKGGDEDTLIHSDEEVAAEQSDISKTSKAKHYANLARLIANQGLIGLKQVMLVVGQKSAMVTKLMKEKYQACPVILKRRLLIGVGVMLVVIASGWVINDWMHSHSSQVSKQAILMTSNQGSSSAAATKMAMNMQAANEQDVHANMMQKKLDEMKETLSHSALSSKQLRVIKNQMRGLAHSISQMKANSMTIKEAILESQKRSKSHADQQNHQMKTLENQLNKISKAVVKEKYLPVSVLPFEVAGIDFWNGKAMLSIAVKDINGVEHYKLIGQGMSYGNGGKNHWVLVKLQTSPNVAIFSNQNGQKVRASL